MSAWTVCEPQYCLVTSPIDMLHALQAQDERFIELSTDLRYNVMKKSAIGDGFPYQPGVTVFLADG